MEGDFRERLDRLESFMTEHFARSEVRMERLERRVAAYVRLGARQVRELRETQKAAEERITALVDSHHKLLEVQARTEKSLQALIDTIHRTNGR